MEMKDKIMALAGKANSPKELFELAAREGLKLSKEQAAACFESLKNGAALGDDALQSIVGGIAEEGLMPKIVIPGGKGTLSLSSCDDPEY